MMAESIVDEESIFRLQKYLQIITVHPNPDYKEAVTFIEDVIIHNLMLFLELLQRAPEIWGQY